MKKTQKIIVLMPIYNDWQSASLLCNSIAESLKDSDLELFKVVLVNDGSHNEYEEEEEEILLPCEIVNLTINLGHQRAIAVGLCHIRDNYEDLVDFVVVMDSDGEDLPKYIPELCRKSEETNKIVFAERSKRSENLTFKAGYYLYKLLFKFLTRKKIKFGNFSCLPIKKLKKVTLSPDLWNHYSASILKSKLDIELVPTERGKRYFGSSKMNIESLMMHGFSAISIYADTVIIRLLVAIFIVLLLIVLASLSLLFLKYFTEYPILGWTSNVMLSLINLTFSLLSILLILLLLQLNSRKDSSNSVLHFYKNYIDSVTKLNEHYRLHR